MCIFSNLLIYRFQIISLELYFCLNGLLPSVQVWIMLDSHVKIIEIETCWDVLFYVAQVLGGFFIINLEGKLELRKYGKDPVMKVEQRHRFFSSFSDFITRYTAVSSTNKQTQIAGYYALDPDNGLTMNLGVNPLLQFGLKETREMLCRNILADLSVIRYVPFDSDTIGNPALDLGMCLRLQEDRRMRDRSPVSLPSDRKSGESRA